MRVGSWVMIGEKQVGILTGYDDEGRYLVHPVNEKGETLMKFSESLNRLVTDERTVVKGGLREAAVGEIPTTRRPIREVKR